MTVEQTNLVDILAVDKSSGVVKLVITDHLDWTSSSSEHLMLLQDKINTYLRYIESGEMVASRPETQGQKVVISIVSKYPFNKSGKEFFDTARGIVEKAGYALTFEVHST
jgi:hypothetical protein